jgi:hypothetical protein
MDTDIEQLLRDSAPTIALPDDVAVAVSDTARLVTEQKRRTIRPRRLLIAAAACAAAVAVGAGVLGRSPESSTPGWTQADSYSARLALVAAQAPANLSLPPGVTLNDAAAAVLHKITVDPGYAQESGLRTLSDVYRRYAQCQAFAFKPAYGTTVNGLRVTPTNPTPGGPAYLVEPHATKSEVPHFFVQTECTDGLGDRPKTTK